jgi:hypothetical protein
MNTISTVSLTNGCAATASTSTILAIDLGKYKSVACLHDRDSGEFRFTTFDTSRAELGELLAKERPAVVIIEACLLAGWVRDLCDHCGVRCLVANTASAGEKRGRSSFDGLICPQKSCVPFFPSRKPVSRPPRPLCAPSGGNRCRANYALSRA